MGPSTRQRTSVNDEDVPGERNILENANKEQKVIKQSVTSERIDRRQTLSEVTNESRPVLRSKNVITGCFSCGVNPCITRGCFNKWHVHLQRNLLWNDL
jgi:hypothetical protein